MAIICRDSATNQHIFRNADLTAIRVVSGTQVNLYFNSQDSSGLDVNVVQLTTSSGEAPDVATRAADFFHDGKDFVFDDVDSRYDISGVSAVNSVTFNGVPDSGTFAKHVVETLSADKTVADSDSGKVFRVNKDGITIDLPVADAAAVGQVFEFLVVTAQTSSNLISFKANAANSDLFTGAVNNMGTSFAADGSDDNLIELNATTKGGLAGGKIKFTYTAANEISVDATLVGSGTAATPFGTQA